MELLFCMPFVFFHFKAIGADKRVDYKGGTIKNQQNTISNWGVNGGVYAPYPPTPRRVGIKGRPTQID